VASDIDQLGPDDSRDHVLPARKNATPASSEASRPGTAPDLAAAYRLHGSYLNRIAMRILGTSEDSGCAEDVVQDSFLDAQRGLSKLRDAAAIRPWLATIVVRHARRRLQRRRLRRFLHLGGGANSATDRAGRESVTALLSSEASPDVHAQLREVYDVLDTLRPQARIAWVLRRVEGEPLERVAEMCGCSRATAHRRITEAQRALEKLNP